MTPSNIHAALQDDYPKYAETMYIIAQPFPVIPKCHQLKGHQDTKWDSNSPLMLIAIMVHQNLIPT